jgi:hypothetical protein
MKEVDYTKLRIDILDCAASTVTRGKKLFIAFSRTPNMILTKNTIKKHYFVKKDHFGNFGFTRCREMNAYSNNSGDFVHFNDQFRNKYVMK